MSKDKDKLLETYKTHATNNEIEILRSHECGCFFCCTIFDARKVSDWASEDGGGASAVCPECGMPAVIGDASGVPLDETLLKKMNAAFYANGAVDIESAEAYAFRYLNNQITHNADNENHFERSLALLASTGNAHANYLMGQMYSGKAEFHKPNFELAKAFFSDQSLKNNASALCRLGFLYVSKAIKSRNKFEGYECLAKSAALGSLEAIALMADCYVLGDPVKKDASFAFSAVRSAFIDIYPDYVSAKSNWEAFPEFPLRLATYYYDGVACDKDHVMALRYFLLARFATNFRNSMSGGQDNVFTDCSPIINSTVASIAKEISAKEGRPVCDADTFYDTYGDPDMSEESDKTFELNSYSPSEMTLSFSITSKSPGFIFDVGNLCCLPSPEKVDWNFEQVAAFKFVSPDDTVFNRIQLHPDGDGWDFVKKELGGDCMTVASVRFVPLESFKKILFSEKRKTTAKKKTGSVKKKAPSAESKKKGKKE